MTRELDIHAHYEAQLASRDRTIGELVGALGLAANRLSAAAVNGIASGERAAGEYSMWAKEARTTLATLADETAGGA